MSVQYIYVWPHNMYQRGGGCEAGIDERPCGSWGTHLTALAQGKLPYPSYTTGQQLGAPQAQAGQGRCSTQAHRYAPTGWRESKAGECQSASTSCEWQETGGAGWRGMHRESVCVCVLNSNTRLCTHNRVVTATAASVWLGKTEFGG